MDLPHLTQQTSDFVRDNWLKIGWSAVWSVGILYVGTWWGRRRARSEWSSKQFLHRINFSLNQIRDNKLLIRTLAEMDCREVFQNDVAVDRVLAAAMRTDQRSALLPLKQDDRWYVLNSVLNELSERFATGFLKQDLGAPVVSQVYLACLTFESVGDLKTRKVRVMLIRKDMLLSLPAEPPMFERPHHSTRFKTLQQLAESFKTDPSDFIEVELSV
ncbi:MAG TPA: hypothetical protein VGB55_15950 [Tepidisphaeraceae bacterium]|jgi:hypothetical protein